MVLQLENKIYGTPAVGQNTWYSSWRRKYMVLQLQDKTLGTSAVEQNIWYSSCRTKHLVLQLWGKALRTPVLGSNVTLSLKWTVKRKNSFSTKKTLHFWK
jgi:hypothetical protein